jgi:hypothetical protein
MSAVLALPTRGMTPTGATVEPVCPSCGSSDILAIIYGLPPDDPSAYAGQRVELWGCCLGPDDPRAAAPPADAPGDGSRTPKSWPKSRPRARFCPSLAETRYRRVCSKSGSGRRVFTHCSLNVLVVKRVLLDEAVTYRLAEVRPAVFRVFRKVRIVYLVGSRFDDP